MCVFCVGARTLANASAGVGRRCASQRTAGRACVRARFGDRSGPSKREDCGGAAAQKGTLPATAAATRSVGRSVAARVPSMPPTHGGKLGKRSAQSPRLSVSISGISAT